MSVAKRSIVIHGHFYQPPRESPWTGLIPTEPSAAPFANWNERILHEAYAPNAHATIKQDSVIWVHNNYEALNFDFGPTLIEWLARHGKAAYGAVLRGDVLSAERWDGHGNAIAQSYNHSILPLLSAVDRDVQIAWGIEDFRFRFGRAPEGMWLPECAADPPTLEAVARAGIRFIILAPWQGEFRSEGPEAHNAAAGPFEWRSGDLRLLVFRYDRDLAGYVSFGDALTDGQNLAATLINQARALPEGSTLLIATDGETFGHHKRSGATELARLVERIKQEPDLEITNCSEIAARGRVAGSFEIHGATAWSCAHGVERWRSDCGCRLTEGTSQQWRLPLREAMEFLKRHLDTLYMQEAGRYLADPLAALKESIRLAVDPDPAAGEAFFSRHKVADEIARERLLSLFEMQRAAHATFTSCAWFFDDFGGLEGRIALRWAARALELGAFFSPSIEPELLERLRPIHSNRHEIGDAATLYLSLKSREARGKV